MASTSTLPDNNFVLDVTAADVNGDGIADIISVGGSAAFSVFVGNGNGTFRSPGFFAGTGGWLTSVNAADVNGDGKLDLLGVDTDNGELSVLIGNGNGTFQAARSTDFGGGGFHVVATDVNGDGVIDPVVTAGSMRVLLGNQDPTGRRNNLQAAYDLGSIQGARSALDSTAVLLDRINRERGNIGAAQSRLQAVASTLRVAGENFDAARSRIVDADVAQESAELTRTSIVQQAASSVLAQANQQPGLALLLLSS